MTNRDRELHPATLFSLLTVAIVFLSWIFSIYGMAVVHPHTGETIAVQSLLSPEGIRWWLRNVAANYTSFAPLGMVMVAMLGLGVAEHSGFIHAAIRWGMKGRSRSKRVILWVIVLGILSNVIGDAGYIILIPIAATLFRFARLNPVAGIITAFVSVACGYSANIIISTLDPLMARITREAGFFAGIPDNIGPLSNYYFTFASTFLVAAVIYFITWYYLLPAIEKNEPLPEDITHKYLSKKERRAFLLAVAVGVIYMGIVAFATFSPWGILRGITGGMTRSPFIMGILFLLSFGAGLSGAVYGFSSGRYKSDKDILAGLVQPMKSLGFYFVIVFFAAQMFACFSYTNLDRFSLIYFSQLFATLVLPRYALLILFMAFCATTNLLMVSATGKWSFMAFIFIPLFASAGIEPAIVQCAFRIGDSATNAITPFLFYMPLVLTYIQQYLNKTSYGLLFRYTWRYTVAIFICWSLFLVAWYYFDLPTGL